MNVSTSAAVTRRRGGQASQPEDDENAALLNLGPEFQLDQVDYQGNHAPLTTLNLSEARILLCTALRERQSMIEKLTGVQVVPNAQGELDDEMLAKLCTAPGANEMLNKTLTHLAKFARFGDAESCAAVENLLTSEENSVLHPFEVAQLGSLACGDVDEAITLIPSLNEKRDQVDLQRILDEVNRLETNYAI